MIAARYGAWPWGPYRLGLYATPGTALAYGIGAAKGLLKLRYDLEDHIVLDSTRFGEAAVLATKEAQRALNFGIDGQLGPQTARALLRRLLTDQERAREIPDHLLCKLIGLESGFGLGAISAGGDLGLAQVNPASHPDVSNAEAFDPFFSVPWAGNRLCSSYAVLKDWDSAIAAHNAPAYADDWLAAGKPTTGGKDIQVGDKTYPMFTWLALYVNAVKSITCS